MLCYELLVKSPPFLASSKKETHKLIKSVNFHIPDHVSFEATKLIKKVNIYFSTLYITKNLKPFFYRKLLIKDPAQRLTASCILEDAWIKKYAEVK